MSWTEKRKQLQTQATKFDKSVRLVTKDNFVSRFIAWALFILSFGRFKRKSFLVGFATTIGNYIFFPKEWTAETVKRILPHESRHIKQFKWLGFGIHPLIGLPLGTIVYALFPLPMFLAFGRFYMELDADKAGWKYLLEQKIYTVNQIREVAIWRAESLSSVGYFWALPKSWALSLYKKAAEEVINEYQKT